MACEEQRTRQAEGATTPWRVSVVQPRRARGESNLYLRARRTRDGREEEQRCSAATLDPAQAEVERARFEADLNAGDGTLPAIMDARIAHLVLEVAHDTKSASSVEGFRIARARMAEVLNVSEPTRAAVLRARDQLAERGAGAETINTYLRRAAACWRWAEERGMVTTPWPRVRALPKPARSKRPYTPAELEAVLAWVATWQGGRWHALLSLVADTGRRVSEVCALAGRDVDYREGTVRVLQKGRRPLVVPVSPEVLALLPRRAPSALLFPRPTRGGGTGPARRDAVRSVVRRAIVAVGIADGERLDTHSLRRSFVADAHRAGVPDDVARRLSGHETRAMLGHYQRDAVGDDLRAAQETVRSYRAARTSPPPSPAAGEAGDRKSWAERDSNPRPHPCKGPRPDDVSTASAHGSAAGAPGGEGQSAPVDAPFLPLGQDALTALRARWRAECPEAFDGLIEDEAVRAEWRGVIRAHPVAKPAREKGADRAAR